MAGAIILAAGRGERLNGIAAPFMKPALLVNGVPLIVQQVRNALEVTTCITLVLAPENARSMIDLVHHSISDLDWQRVNIVVQPFPGSSVVDALRRGFELYDRDVIVLMGDNVVPPLTVRQMWDDYRGEGMRPELLIATREMPWDDAERFTYRVGDTWYEKEHLDTVVPAGQTTEVWVGPFIVNAVDELYAAMSDSIGRAFNAFSDVRTWPAQCSDIGVPEAFT